MAKQEKQGKTGLAERTPTEPKTDAITIKQVLASGVIPNATDVKDLTKGWFKNNKTGTCYRIERMDGTLTVMETKQSKAVNNPKTPKPPKPRVHKEQFTTIKCSDCGTERKIHVQDKFQVKRCTECQKKHRRVQRNERLKAKRAEARMLREKTTPKTLPAKATVQK